MGMQSRPAALPPMMTHLIMTARVITTIDGIARGFIVDRTSEAMPSPYIVAMTLTLIMVRRSSWVVGRQIHFASP